MAWTTIAGAAAKHFLRFGGRALGWAGAAYTAYELVKLGIEKGGIKEKFTHYYCQEGKVYCGRQIPDDLIEQAIAADKKGQSFITVKCPTSGCPASRTIDTAKWANMKEKRKKYK